MSDKFNTLIIADGSPLSRDFINSLDYEKKTETTLIAVNSELYHELKKDEFKDVILLSSAVNQEVDEVFKKIEDQNFNSVILLLMHLDKVDSISSNYSELNYLVEQGLKLNITLSSKLVDKIVKSRGRLILPIYYYRNDILTNSALYSSIYTAVESYFLSIKKSIIQQSAQAELLYLKSPTQYTNQKYQDTLELLRYEVYKANSTKIKR